MRGALPRESRDGMFFPPLTVLYQKKLVMSNTKVYVIITLSTIERGRDEKRMYGKVPRT